MGLKTYENPNIAAIRLKYFKQSNFLTENDPTVLTFGPNNMFGQPIKLWENPAPPNPAPNPIQPPPGVNIPPQIWPHAMKEVFFKTPPPPAPPQQNRIWRRWDKLVSSLQKIALFKLTNIFF